MDKYLAIGQITISILLVVSILLQRRGTGLGSAFGGEGGSYYTKRGFEKALFYATIALAAAFLGAAFLNLVV